MIQKKSVEGENIQEHKIVYDFLLKTNVHYDKVILVGGWANCREGPYGNISFVQDYRKHSFVYNGNFNCLTEYREIKNIFNVDP